MHTNAAETQLHATSSLRRTMVVAFALMTILAATVPPASAAPTSYSEKVILAGANWVTEDETTSSDLTIRVYYLSTYSSETGWARYKTPQVTLFYTHEVLDPETNLVTRTEYEGFVGADSTARFVFDPGFESASATVSVPLFGYQCVEGGPAGIVEPVCHDLEPATVEVALEWTGFGEITVTNDRTKVKDVPTFGQHTRLSIEERSATVTGTVAGDGLVLADGPGSSAILLVGAYSEDIVVK